MGGRYVVTGASLQDLQRVASAAKRLAGPEGHVDAVVLVNAATTLAPVGSTIEQVAAGLGGLADAVLAYDGGEWLRGDLWATALLDAAAAGVEAVLVADAPAAREAAGRVAVALGGAAVSMCETLYRDDGGRLVAKRSIYGGVADGEIVLDVAPAVCLCTSGAFEGEVGGDPASTDSRRLEPPAHEITVIAEEPVEKTVDLAAAATVVAVGRGFAKAEDLGLVQPLLRRLGAELGCSRPIAEDFKWLPQERQVGLTGVSVAPNLYLALGISGQVQHLAGIKGAKVVVSVNNDARAPMARNADYAVVADLYKFVPELLAALDQN